MTAIARPGSVVVTESVCTDVGDGELFRWTHIGVPVMCNLDPDHALPCPRRGAGFSPQEPVGEPPAADVARGGG